MEKGFSHDFAHGCGGPVNQRVFLLLQSVCSPFFLQLADQLQEAGHRVEKINFTAGDALYWGFRRAQSFRGRAEKLAIYYQRQFQALGITDVVLFGDCRPIHQPAVEVAKKTGLRIHVFEEGYFRPHCITLERDGVNTHSLLPRDPAWFWDVGGAITPAQSSWESFTSPFRIRAAHDVLYHCTSFWNYLFYPGYRNHSPISMPVEYVAYLRRFSLVRLRKQRDVTCIQTLASSGKAYFVLPLQLNTDAQIRQHSPYRDMSEVIVHVLRSFAMYAPKNSELIIKNHPLDMGIVDFEGEIHQLCQQYDLAGRVHYVESGDLNVLLKKARGVVTVNSTVGSVALGFGCPTIALSDPIYNIPGLTFQGRLDDFWQDEGKPSVELFNRFRNVVITATQVNGGFYCKTGIALAARNSARILTQDISPLEQLLQRFPLPKTLVTPGYLSKPALQEEI